MLILLAVVPLALTCAASPATASHKVSPAQAIAEGLGVPAIASKGKLKTPCSLEKVGGLGAAAWAQASRAGRPWAWQGVAKKSSAKLEDKVVAALDACPGLGIFTTDWDSDGLEEKTTMLTGMVNERAVTVLVFKSEDMVTVVGTDNGKPYYQNRDVLISIMKSQGVTLHPIPGM